MSQPPTPPGSPPRSAPGVTALLLAWSAGDGAALDALLPLVYGELRGQAERAMRQEATGHTLQPTALVHEVYLRLVDQSQVTVRDRSQFFGIAARCMRQVLVDHARARRAAKRGGAQRAVTLDDGDALATEPVAEVVAVHEALERLAALDPEQARLVELRYFGGMTIEETATLMGTSPATVKREWAIARAWLRRELESVDSS